jgi:photosystem II stability/assembly factor-like uncharacterized protein
MRKIKIIVLLTLTLLVSGCSVAGKADGGVYKSIDGGMVFEQKIKIDEKKNIGNTNVLTLEIDPKNTDTIYLGTKENGIFRSTDGGETWVKDINNFTSVTSIVINPESSQIIYISAVKSGRGKILKTENGGEKWDEVFTERTSGPAILSLAMDKFNPNVLYAGDSLGGIYKTTDGGKSWKNLLRAKSSVRKIALDSVNTNQVYFGTTNSGALVTTNGGYSFDEIVDSGYIYNIEPHPYRENALYLSDKKGLQVSYDTGKTWNQLQTLVKPTELGSRGLAINPTNDQEILFASGEAFYKTTNGGETWMPVQFNISRSIETIKINSSNTNVVYLGTNKRGSQIQLLPF